MLQITAIEQFAALLSALGHACAPQPSQLHSAAQFERDGHGFDAMASYLAEVEYLYWLNWRADLPPPVTPVISIPPKLVHVTCTGNTQVVWEPEKFRIINKDGDIWRYDSGSFWEHLDGDDPYFPEDLVMRWLILWRATPNSNRGRSLSYHRPDLYWRSVDKFIARSPEWAKRLGFLDL